VTFYVAFLRHQRLALALQADGWVVRSVIVWQKPSPMPQALSGWAWKRCRIKVASKDTSHMHDGRGPNGCPMRPHSGNTMRTSTQWQDCPGCPKCAANNGFVLRRGSWRPTSSYEVILLLAKSQNYFADGEPVKTISQGASPREFGRKDASAYGLEELTGNMAPGVQWHDNGSANARDVQSWSSESMSEHLCTNCGWFGHSRHMPSIDNTRRCPRCKVKALTHYASFPTALVAWCLRAGTSARGYCPACGAPWARVMSAGNNPYPGSSHNHANDSEQGGTQMHESGIPAGTIMRRRFHECTPPKTLDWRPTCTCTPPRDPRPALVLDPYCGSGRTGIAAQRLGLDFVGVELSESYCSLAKKLLYNDAPLFSDVQDS